MSRRLISILRSVNDQSVVRVKVYRDSDWREFQCEIPGKPDATYYTDDRTDALSTAQKMRDEEDLNEAVHDMITQPGELL